METSTAVEALDALAHETRLRVFRLLASCSPGGLPAGAIAARLEIAPSTLSFHLAHLERAGLVDAEADGRTRVYTLRGDGFRALLGFLADDCCQGRPELCRPAVGRRARRRTRA